MCIRDSTCDNQHALSIIKKIDFDVLSFTGSAPVGWLLKSEFYDKKVILELGGNAGMIVDDLHNFDSLISNIIEGAFAYSGQVCIHLQRLIVNKNIFNELLPELLKRIEALIYGDPLDEQTQISVMITEEAAINAENKIREAVLHGAKLITGGSRNASFLSPTIILEPQDNLPVVAEEVFAPVLCLFKYNDFNEAIKMINNSRYGLSAAVWTSSIHQIKKAIEKIEVGSLLINASTTFRIDHLPFGGWKLSGTGLEGTMYAIQEFQKIKTIII